MPNIYRINRMVWRDKMKRFIFALNIFMVISLLMAACVPQTDIEEKATEMPPTATSPVVKTQIEPIEEDVLYLNLIWHQHQPLYYKNDEGVYTRPWVRVHATKDYYDMVSILEQYPDVHITYNLTPVLIKQLEDFVNNDAIDLYWKYSLTPASELTNDEKDFILRRFFDANWDNIIARFPRYQELLNKRGGASDEEIQKAISDFSNEDFRDLQIWFNLAWIDPDFLEKEPLSVLLQKQRNFSEEDKTILFAEIKKIMGEVIPIHEKLQNEGQIEVITTPYAHPILPLLVDSNIAQVGNPSANMPTQFSFAQDAISHLSKSREIYFENFGQEPKGLWPGEGSVAQLIVPHVINAGYEWMASGEPVLAKSLGIDSFTRDGEETVDEVDLLYRPYYVKNRSGEKLAVFFRDGTISDKVGFTYSGMSGTAAANDLIGRLENIREKIKANNLEGPHIVSIIVDGENAWEYYENDGKEFFHALYQALSESKTIKTITPSEYLEMYPEQREIDDLFPGAWFSPNYDTWIGEAEENQAWEYLRQTREVLAQYDISKQKSINEDVLAEAQDYMYLAEGSDWFWWYGADQDSGQDTYFDEGFRALLKKVYETIEEPVPAFVNVPIIQDTPISADKSPEGLTTPTIDGLLEEGEWNAAGRFTGNADAMIDQLQYTYDQKYLYFLLDASQFSENSKVAIYMKTIKGDFLGTAFTNSEGGNTRLLGINATHLYEWENGTVSYYMPTQGGWRLQDEHQAIAEKNSVLEFGIPIADLGELAAGDEIQFIVVEEDTQIRIPEDGPGQIIIPDLGLSTLVLEVNDPEGDDFGPGTYTYPTDSVFSPQVYDIKSFVVSYDENYLIFKVDFFGAVPNPWGSPNNLAIQTIDVYIDTDPGAQTGARALLPGRNLSLSPDDGWDFAVWAEGWTPQILKPDPETLAPIEVSDVEYKIIVDSAGRSVTIRVAKTLFDSSNYEEWGFAAMVMGQEGYPATGVWRIRDVNPVAEQWRFGGAGNTTNHTRVIDLAWPEGETISQAEMLSDFAPLSESLDKLTPDDFATIDLIIAK